MVFNATFNNISVLLVEETRVPKKTTDKLSHNVLFSTPCLSGILSIITSCEKLMTKRC